MKKIFILLLTFVLVFSLNGCSSNDTQISNDLEGTQPIESINGEMYPSENTMNGGAIKGDSTESPSKSLVPQVPGGTAGVSIDKEHQKIIKSGSLTIESVDFDNLLESVKKEIESYEGYIESMNIYNGNYLSEAYKSGYIQVRIPEEKYNNFILSMNELGYVSSEQLFTSDVSEQYFDSETRVATLKVQEERLIELLKVALEIEDVFKIETELSNVRYEIESLTSTLRRLDSLESYSTISISLVEVGKIESVEPKEKESLGAKLKFAFKEGLSDFSDEVESFIVSLARNFVTIVIFLVFIGLGIRFYLRNKKNDKYSKLDSPKEDKE